MAHMVPRPLIVHIVALRLIKWHTHHLLTINPLVSVSHSLTIANKNNDSKKGSETFIHSIFNLTSPTKEELLSFHFVLIFTTRVSLFPWLGWKLLCLRLINQQDIAILLVTTMAKGVRRLSSWIEVAPTLLIISPKKVPISPVLETITEDEAEECNEDS